MTKMCYLFQWAIALLYLLPSISLGSTMSYSVVGLSFYSDDNDEADAGDNDSDDQKSSRFHLLPEPSLKMGQDQASWFGMSEKVASVHQSSASSSCSRVTEKIIQPLTTILLLPYFLSKFLPYQHPPIIENVSNSSTAFDLILPILWNS